MNRGGVRGSKGAFNDQLLLAAEFDDARLVRLCIEEGANVNVNDEFHYTPLHIAALHGSCEAAKILIRADGLEVNALDSHNQTPLHLAAARNNIELVELLLSRGADVNVISLSGQTPLEIALLKQNWSVAEKLKSAAGKVPGRGR